ncbi:MerR family DNA-binding transcriptional regulator [Streptomyces sp. DSM 44915]|uniref:MerR family DNA-binding transcriptional regulator n=1 Tax=Streptomyces chisholmiae TaxID=3075540 RepID=A0ABU2JLB9_9ACTN|nr:HEAT repeat domain-containing protein [Streptomyces sp. DSM 44915]MDT0265782.1 MerR family DNA-binding transcriptional regulator [Streptomyces sp. DSM 44915]
MLIGEVARRSGVSARMLRHYDALGLVRPTGRTHGGYREYAPADIQRIFQVESLRSLGLSLREVGQALDRPDFAPGALVADLIRRTRERIAAETELLDRLRHLDAAEPAGWEDVLRVVPLLQALGSEHAGQRQRAALTADPPASATALAEAALREADPVVAGALRWALARAGEAALPPLAAGLAAAAPEVRRRAAQTIAEFPQEAATALLRSALADQDPAVRADAALALGARGAAEAIGPLVGLLVEAASDAAAADALSALVSQRPALADRVAAAIAGTEADPPGRLRLAQALADLPGTRATAALTALTQDPDRTVARTAAAVLTTRPPD